MELKNITPFDKFKKIYEEAIPNEFSNSTGFRESLVGRAVFGILRYFKKGIQLGQLEYYKRKLENEYFAAILRLCAEKEIDLKTGVDPSIEDEPADDTGGGGNQPTVDPYETEYCEILSKDYLVVPSNTDGIDSIKQLHTTELNNLTTILNTLTEQSDKDDCQRLIDPLQKIIACCDAKLLINIEFKNLSGSTDNAAIIACLDKIKLFFESPEAKYCSTYKGTDNEKNLIKSFSTPTADPGVKGKADEIIPMLDNFNYRYYDLIQEKITSGINKSVGIEQMLGDQLRGADAPSKNINIYEYLKKIGINSVDEINFVELVKLFRDDPKYQELVSSDKYLNVASIRKIQYAVADGIIFHVKKTPDNVGINPGTGGGTQYDEDTSMRKVWEKKVEFVKSEFAGFFNFRTVDPFVLLNLSDAMRKRGEYGADPVVLSDAGATKALANTLALETNAVKLGLTPKGDGSVATARVPFVVILTNGGKVYYPVLALQGDDNSATPKIYRYIGIINFDKILSEKKYDDPTFDTIANKYANAIWDTTVKPDVDPAFLNFLRIPATLTVSSADFDSIYISKSDFTRMSSKKAPESEHKLRFLFNFLLTADSYGKFKGAKPSARAANFILKCLKVGNNTLDAVVLTNVKESTKNNLVSFKVGEFFEIQSGWRVKYFPDGGAQIISKYSTDDVAPINKAPYIPSIVLNPPLNP